MVNQISIGIVACWPNRTEINPHSSEMFHYFAVCFEYWQKAGRISQVIFLSLFLSFAS